ncbi:P-loop ATPase, MinD superfamily [Mesotoga prima MesG1.Ag.4.2]|uniref:p-loop ATPase, MinD superfamily n=1 Tax=Mesotoga prima MesG1.Ag.4.2 TaxID=660470 RepID=I2F3G1_9BACT|nr:ATP-binding protein [Mesotoga prima]AFK06464.1 P-loop ATPase, MinD superfamily [Mesotoga prima MesG1.Ag.4.2]
MVIAVLSGKGGTGKTTLATNLAGAISDEFEVQLLDADAEEPDVHLFFEPNIHHEEGVELLLPVIDNKKCTRCGKCAEVCQFGALSVFQTGVMVFESLCHGCGLCTFICPEKAITERPKVIGKVQTGKINKKIDFGMGILEIGEPSPVKVIRTLKKHINRDRIVIIDSPPGTSCSVVETLRNVDYAILVTEPTPFGLHDLKLAVEIVREMDIPFGIVINRDTGSYTLVDEYASEENFSVLERIPFDRGIAESYSEGKLFVETSPIWKARFKSLAERILSSAGVS